MGELEEFAEALLAQLSTEINEEKEIAELMAKIKEDKSFDLEFPDLEQVSNEIFQKMAPKVKEFLGVSVPNDVKIKFPGLVEFKILKGKKVFANKEGRKYVDELFEAVSGENLEKITELIRRDTAKFLVFSTYSKSYISKISTTYGDYLDSTIYLNKFILSNYPQIILYKQGSPFKSKFENVKSGYLGALKMTILEEQIHSVQKNLHKINQKAVIQVNSINEDLAKIILGLDDSPVSKLSEYLHLEEVPEDFPIARRANLFFALNPDNFIVNVLGPDVMTFTKVEVDPKISEEIPDLLEIYQNWLKPIQTHHAVFTTMEGMAEFAVHNILKDDEDFQNYLTTFMGTDPSSYHIRKSLGREFTREIFEKHGKQTFSLLIKNPPSTRELKNPKKYLDRIKEENV